MLNRCAGIMDWHISRRAMRAARHFRVVKTIRTVHACNRINKVCTKVSAAVKRKHRSPTITITTKSLWCQWQVLAHVCHRAEPFIRFWFCYFLWHLSLPRHKCPCWWSYWGKYYHNKPPALHLHSLLQNVFANFSRSVSEEERSFALGMQFVIFRLFGYIPAPILFGNLIDSTCLLWKSTCGEKGGRCLIYDIETFRYKWAFHPIQWHWAPLFMQQS